VSGFSLKDHHLQCGSDSSKGPLMVHIGKRNEPHAEEGERENEYIKLYWKTNGGPYDLFVRHISKESSVTRQQGPAINGVHIDNPPACRYKELSGVVLPPEQKTDVPCTDRRANKKVQLRRAAVSYHDRYGIIATHYRYKSTRTFRGRPKAEIQPVLDMARIFNGLTQARAGALHDAKQSGYQNIAHQVVSPASNPALHIRENTSGRWYSGKLSAYPFESSSVVRKYADTGTFQLSECLDDACHAILQARLDNKRRTMLALRAGSPAESGQAFRLFHARHIAQWPDIDE